MHGRGRSRLVVKNGETYAFSFFYVVEIQLILGFSRLLNKRYSRSFRRQRGGSVRKCFYHKLQACLTIYRCYLSAAVGAGIYIANVISAYYRLKYIVILHFMSYFRRLLSFCIIMHKHIIVKYAVAD